MLGMIFAAPLAALMVPQSPTPLVDGRCEEAEWTASTVVAADGAYRLRAKRDERFVYLCLEYPDGSLGMVDLYAVAPNEQAPINLHASTKLGERKRGASSWPKYSWWNERGWTTQVNAHETSSAGSVTFHATPQKEIQIAIERFGTGEWRLMAEVLNDKNGTIAARLPAGGAKDDPRTYIPLTVR